MASTTTPTATLCHVVCLTPSADLPSEVHQETRRRIRPSVLHQWTVEGRVGVHRNPNPIRGDIVVGVDDPITCRL
jgi:hypothetical protein